MNQAPSAPCHAQTLIREDYLKTVKARCESKSFKCNDDKLLPRPNHSCFGDFPKTHMPPKNTLVVEPLPLAAAEQSGAAKNKQMGKYAHSPSLINLWTLDHPSPHSLQMPVRFSCAHQIQLNQRQLFVKILLIRDSVSLSGHAHSDLLSEL